MDITSISEAEPFTTKDGSTIRELHHTRAQSLAEARLESGRSTERHYHRRSEEIYFLLEGAAEMELDGDRRSVGPGDAVLSPPGAWHRITAVDALRFLCCCSPPYAHEDTFFD